MGASSGGASASNSARSQVQGLQGRQHLPAPVPEGQGKDCGGSGLCPHQRIKSTCKQCKGASICPHQRQRGRKGQMQGGHSGSTSFCTSAREHMQGVRGLQNLPAQARAERCARKIVCCYPFGPNPCGQLEPQRPRATIVAAGPGFAQPLTGVHFEALPPE